MSVNTLAIEAVANTGVIPKHPSSDSVLAGLTKYIPTESITLYIATVSAQPALTQVASWFTSSIAYWVFVVLTPVLLLLLYLRQLATAGRNWKVSVRSWPWWRVVASTIAFSVWAMAVPGNPVISAGNETQGVIVGFAALFVSTILNILAPFFEKQRS